MNHPTNDNYWNHRPGKPGNFRGMKRSWQTQRGVALIVALILLFVVTLLGLTAIRGTVLQNKMAANQYDRQLAFQAAASALQVAKQAILNSGDVAAYNCKLDDVQCESNPFGEVGSDDIHTVTTGDYEPGKNVAAQPQYVVENLGQWINPNSN